MSSVPQVLLEPLICKRSNCLHSSCAKGVHLPPSPHQVQLYHTAGRSSRYHLDPNCPALRCRDFNTTTGNYVKVVNYLCDRCRSAPREVLAYDEEAIKLAAGLSEVLAVHSRRVGRVDPAQAPSLQRSLKALQKRAWRKGLRHFAEAGVLLAEELLESAGTTWAPPELPEGIIRAAAALTLSPSGERPVTPSTVAAEKVWPLEGLDHLWKTYFMYAAKGQEYVLDDRDTNFRMDSFPSRKEAAEGLLQSWTAQVSALSADPGPLHYVVVPANLNPRNHPFGTWLVGALGEHALCNLPRPVFMGDSARLVLVPELVVGALARLPVHGLAHVGPALDPNRHAVLETALTLWTTNQIEDLRHAFELAHLAV